MLRNKLTFTALAAFSMALAAGCHFYVEDNDGNRNGDGDGDSDWMEPGGDCNTEADNCFAGCYCASYDGGTDGYCEETGTCDENFPCAEGQWCGRDADGDGINETCIPGEEPDPNACEEDADCGGGICEDNQCRDFTCEDHTNETDCNDDASCEAVYGGINCTSTDGSACNAGDMNCTCERFEYARCTDLGE